MRQKKIPMRKCTGCGEMKEKKQLVRVVKAPDVLDENGELLQRGEITVDTTGKSRAEERMYAVSLNVWRRRKRQDVWKKPFPAKYRMRYMKSWSRSLKKAGLPQKGSLSK